MIVPAHDEAGSIGATLDGIVRALENAVIDYEVVVVVVDASTDRTGDIVRALSETNPRIRYHLSRNPRGFGFAVRAGLDVFRGDAVAIMMADGSDSPTDLLRYHSLIEEGYDCAFGLRRRRGRGVAPSSGRT